MQKFLTVVAAAATGAGTFLVAASGSSATPPSSLARDGLGATYVAGGDATPWQRGRAETCPNQMDGNLQELTCSCSGAEMRSATWGTDVYTGDSDICTAARHAGAVDEDGETTVYAAPGRSSYRGSVRNRVATSSWGSYSRSITFRPADYASRPYGEVASGGYGAPACPQAMPGGQARLTCNCMSTGSSGRVWGSVVYTADSDICMAAQHAGVIARNGNVTVISAPGRGAYRGSFRNGVRSANWGAYSRSIVFRRQP